MGVTSTYEDFLRQKKNRTSSCNLDLFDICADIDIDIGIGILISAKALVLTSKYVDTSLAETLATLNSFNFAYRLFENLEIVPI